MHRLIWSGPLAAVLLLAGLFESNVETQSTDATISHWLETHGNGVWIAHATLSALAGVLLVVFGHAVRARIGDGDAARLIPSLSTLTGTMICVGAALFAAVPIGRMFENAPDPDPSVYRYLSAAAASVMVIFLAPACAALAATIGIAGLSTRAVPRWLGVTSVVMAVLMLASAFVAPLMVFGLWLLVTGIALGLRAPRPVGRAVAVAG
jgi:hypothetical protein